LIGQHVAVTVDGSTSDRFFGTVFLGNNCVNECLLKEGFARVHDPICGHESERMAAFRKAQADATAAQLGSHARVEVAPLVVRDYSLNTSKEVAALHLPEFRNVKMRGIVEDILGGNRFALLVPDARVMVRCAVNGLRPLSPSDRLGQEAMAFCAQHYLNRDIEFSIQEVDRSGGYFGNMCLLAGAARVDIAVALLAEGLAEIHDRTASALPNFQELIDVRDKATRNGYGKWANPSRFEASLEVGGFYPVRLIRAATAVDFIVQFLSDTIREIDELINAPTPPVARPLVRNELVCVLYQGARYRGRIEKADDLDRIRVRLIDFDAVIEVTTGELFDLPPRLASIPPQAITVRLAFLALVKDQSEDRSWVWQEFKDYALYLHPLSVDDTAQVLLYDRPTVNSETLNAVLLDQADVRFAEADFDVGDPYKPLVATLKQIAADRNLEENFEDDD
jgi:staphylococcal nuclease domain-containing protein 1